MMQLKQWIEGLFTSAEAGGVGVWEFTQCVAVALFIGLFIALTYTYKSKYTKGFVITLATLPAVVAMVILMVNGNVGAGVAVAGAFSLVRFRSVPGTAKEIGEIFLAMGSGLAVGMGYLGFAIVFAIILSLVIMFYNASKFGNCKSTQRTMRITIPEDLDYTGVFDDLFQRYTSEYELISVKTSNMGSLFKLTYDLNLNNGGEEKFFIDDLRCRNGNLEIIMAKQSPLINEL